MGYIKSMYTNKKIKFYVSGDFNAKNPLWSNNSNDRGNELAKWINKNDMCIVNNEMKPTFINKKTKFG